MGSNDTIPITKIDPQNDARMRWLAIFMVVFGVAFLAISILMLKSLLANQAVSLLEKLVLGTVWTSIAGVSIAAVLYPLREVRPFNLLIQISLFPMMAIAIVGNYYNFIAAPILALLSVLMIPLFAWSVLDSLQITQSLSDRGSMYFIASLASFAFANWGGKYTRFVIHGWLRQKRTYSKLFLLLRPSLLRFYTYGAMAAAYIFANFERFTGLTLITWSGWIVYKDVLVEVLLTYVAVDSVIVAWRDHKERMSDK